MEQLENLGRYQLLRVLGRGAMGVVYEGIDPKLNRQVAVKTILKSQMLDPGLAAEYTARFMREAQAVARLNHPNIVQVFDFGNEADVAYIVMEFIRGKELKSYIEEKRLFAIDETVNIVCELLDALEYAHAAGVIHRDIKPANVMLDAASRVKLTDFGVARLSDAGGQEGTRPGTMVGTPGYMSPEQIKGLTVGPQADLFAVGVLLYQCLTLQKPFTGNSDWDIYYKIVHDDPQPASQLRNGLPPHLDKVIQRALAKDPQDRYPSARAMADDLKLVIGNAVFDDEATRLVVDLPNRDRSRDQTLATSTSIASGRTGTKFSPQTGTTDAERDFWNSIKDSGDIDELESYVAQFPDGLFAKLARIRINKLSGGTIVAESTGVKTIPPMQAAQAQEEARRQAELAARQRAEEERRQAEEAARRQAEETRRTAEQKAAAEAAQRRAAEEAAQRKTAEEAARHKAAEEAAQRKAAEEAVKHKAAEEAAQRKAAEAATARRLAEEAEEARRKAVEEAAKRRALDDEARRMDEESRRAAMAMPAGHASADADSTVMFRRPAAPAPAPAIDDVEAAASKLFAPAPQERPAPPAPPLEVPPKSKLPLIAGGVAAAVLALGALMFTGGDKNKDAAKVAQAPSAPSAPSGPSTAPSAPVAANTTQQADEARAQQARAEEESRRKSREDARLAEEAAQKRAADDARRAAQTADAANKKAQDDARRAEDMAKKQAQDQARRVEEDRKQKEAARRAEEAAKKKEAEEARKKAAESSPEGMLKKARETKKAGNLKEAIKLYTQAHNAGSGQAAKELGDYYHAAGPDQDADFAQLWYGRAQQKGIKVGK